MKQVIFSRHAEERKKQRGLSENDILETLERPDYVKTGLDGGKTATRNIRGRTVMAVYLEKENHLKIITVI